MIEMIITDQEIIEIIFAVTITLTILNSMFLYFIYKIHLYYIERRVDRVENCLVKSGEIKFF